MVCRCWGKKAAAAPRPAARRAEAMPDQISVSEFVAETHEDYKVDNQGVAVNSR